MKLDFDDPPTAWCIRSYAAGRIVIGDTVVTTPVILANGQILDDVLPPCFEDLQPHHFEQITEFGAEIVILGSGRSQRFLDPAIAYPLLRRGIGFEAMDTGAACRCYNVLVAENRSVLAILYMIES